MSAKNFFNGAVSDLFAKVRPTVSTSVKDTVLKYLGQKIAEPFALAVDVGCGTGHSTRPFIPHFKRMVGVDPSPTQIEQARKNYNFPNVKFKVGDADSLPCDDNSVSLVLCVQTAHWLDMPKFYKECNRVLVPNGVLALLGYGLFEVRCQQDPTCNVKLNEAVKTFYNFLVKGKYWDERRYIVDRQYKEFQLPYAEQSITRDDESLYYKKEMDIASLVEYFATFSGYTQYAKLHPDNKLLQELKQK